VFDSTQTTLQRQDVLSLRETSTDYNADTVRPLLPRRRFLFCQNDTFLRPYDLLRPQEDAPAPVDTGVKKIRHMVAWLSGSALVSINVVTLLRAWLILGWVTVGEPLNHLGIISHRSTQPSSFLGR